MRSSESGSCRIAHLVLIRPWSYTDHMGPKFLIVFVITTYINTAAWQYIATGLYDCVDDAIPGYLEPGFWVHSFNGHSVMTVPQITHNHPMSDPDTIKQGWSVPRLLGLWFCFFTTSVVVSLGLARIRWPGERSNQSLEPTADYQEEQI